MYPQEKAYLISTIKKHVDCITEDGTPIVAFVCGVTVYNKLLTIQGENPELFKGSMGEIVVDFDPLMQESTFYAFTHNAYERHKKDREEFSRGQK